MPLPHAGPARAQRANEGGRNRRSRHILTSLKPALPIVRRNTGTPAPASGFAPHSRGWPRERRDRYANSRARHLMRSESHSQIAALRAELQACNASLDAAYKELDLLCYAVSHDLRAPLRAVDGFTRMLLDRAHGRLDDEDRRLLDVVRGNAAKMSALIEDLVRYSRLNRQAMHPARFDMGTLVAESFNGLHAGPTVHLQLQTLPEAWGDRTLLKQVWSELLANAA